MPVGDGTLGRIMSVIGNPVDEAGPIQFTERRGIHQPAPAFTEQATELQVLVTGIKVVDLLAPYQRGGKVGLFGGAGVGKTVLIQELINKHRQKAWRLFGVRRRRRTHARRATTSITR